MIKHKLDRHTFITNIYYKMGDRIARHDRTGWFNTSDYHNGIVAGYDHWGQYEVGNHLSYRNEDKAEVPTLDEIALYDRYMT